MPQLSDETLEEILVFFLSLLVWGSGLEINVLIGGNTIPHTY